MFLLILNILFHFVRIMKEFRTRKKEENYIFTYFFPIKLYTIILDVDFFPFYENVVVLIGLYTYIKRRGEISIIKMFDTNFLKNQNHTT